MDNLKDKAHYIAVTGIVCKEDKFLICKRSFKEKIFPGKWCVPGGKLQQSDFVNKEKNTESHWFDVLENTLQKEIKEETNLEISNIGYVSNLALIRPNGFSTIILSLFADFKEGDIKLCEDELIDYAWVTLDEAKNYDLIENIYEQLEKVASLRK